MAKPPAIRPPATPPDAPPRVGETLAALRQAQSLSLDELSRRAGVSKSMLSQIERAQANPTVAVVWRLANALGVSIGELLGSAPAPERPAIELVAVQNTPALRNPDGSCELRILGPLPLAGRFEWYQLTLQPGGVLDSQPHEAGTQEHLTLVAGTLEVQAGTESRRLKVGETARYAVDQPHAIRNLGKTVAQAWMVVVHPG